MEEVTPLRANDDGNSNGKDGRTEDVPEAEDDFQPCSACLDDEVDGCTECLDDTSEIEEDVVRPLVVDEHEEHKRRELLEEILSDKVPSDDEEEDEGLPELQESTDSGETVVNVEEKEVTSVHEVVDAADSSSQQRGVYKMPNPKEETVPDTILVWPAKLAILAVVWQIRLIFALCSFGFSVSGFLLGLLRDPVKKLADMKKLLTERLHPLTSDLTPRITGFAKRVGWGLFSVAYVATMLSVLVVPVIFTVAFFVTRLVEEPVNVKAPMYFNYTESRPSATVPVAFHGTKKHQQTEVNVRPYSWEKIRVAVSLTLPESDYNRQLGMFQVTAELYSVQSELLERSSRPCMLKFRSAPIRHAKTLLFSLPLLLEVSGEYQTLHLNMIELRKQGNVLVSTAKVVIEPRAGFTPGTGLPEIYAAEIRINSELPWKKSLVYRWKWTIYVWSAGVLFLGEVFIVMCCFRRLLLPSKAKKPQFQQKQHRGSTEPIEKSIPVASSALRKTRGQAKKRVTFQDDVLQNLS